MPDSPTFLADRLIQEGQKSILYFRALSTQDWSTTIYTEGESWSPKQILAHFLASEISLYRLLENILAGGEGAPEDFDLNRYNERKVKQLEEETAEKMIDQFIENRSKTADLVKRLKESDLEIQGRHPFLGKTSISEIVKIIYRHNQIHQREIRNALKNSARGDF